MPFELPDNLHPNCGPVAWLLGTWRGNGHGTYPTIESFQFGQELIFTHDGRPFFHYLSRAWIVDDDPSVREAVRVILEGEGFAHVKQLPEADRDRFGELVYRFFWGLLSNEHLVAGDPHPGNYLLLDDGRILFSDPTGWVTPGESTTHWRPPADGSAGTAPAGAPATIVAAEAVTPIFDGGMAQQTLVGARPKAHYHKAFGRWLNGASVAGASSFTRKSSLFEARFGWSRTVAGKSPLALGTPNALDAYGIPGLPTDDRIAGGLPTQLIVGFSDLGRQATNPQWQFPTVFNPKINYTWTRGRHSMKSGYEFQHIQTEVQDVNPLYGRDTYHGQFTRPSGAAASTVGHPSDPNWRREYSVTSQSKAPFRRAARTTNWAANQGECRSNLTWPSP